MVSVLLSSLLLRELLLFVQKRKEKKNQFSSTLADYLCISMALYHHGTQVLRSWQWIGNIKTTALWDEARMNARACILWCCSLCVNTDKAKMDGEPMFSNETLIGWTSSVWIHHFIFFFYKAGTSYRKGYVYTPVQTQGCTFQLFPTNSHA